MTIRKDIKAWVSVGILTTAMLVAWSAFGHRVQAQPRPRSVIVFMSTRDDSGATPADAGRIWAAAEIYLMDGDGSNAQRLTANTYADGFPALSPDGKRIVFDSDRQRAATDPINASTLFVMNVDGTEQKALVRGSSATWAPDSRRIAFHASASSGGRPIKADPGAATTDNDIFVLDVDHFLKTGGKPKNLTNSPSAIDDDPAWSPDGRHIAFTSHAVTDNPINSTTAEVYVMNADGSGTPTRLTHNNEEERAPAWSPDGKRIVLMCRKGSPQQPGAVSTFELCVMNADGTSMERLTYNTVADLTPSWSSDGGTIVFHRRVGGQAQFQLFTIHPDGGGEKQLTFPPGFNAFASFGLLR